MPICSIVNGVSAQFRPFAILVDFPVIFARIEDQTEFQARSSGVERLLDMQEVGGSKPPVPTICVFKWFKASTRFSSL